MLHINATMNLIATGICTKKWEYDLVKTRPN